MSYTDDQLLDTCLNVTGHFEGGTPKYSAVTGNFDGMGLSAGIIQWNLGQGTLQQLLKTIAAHMGATKADSMTVRATHPLRSKRVARKNPGPKQRKRANKPAKKRRLRQFRRPGG